ncbi:MAG: transposase [Frankiales bacterium]|nr:transposase [Frankiales bacterium]
MKGEPDLRAAVLNRLRRELDASGRVSNESVRQAAHRLSMTPRHVRRLLTAGAAKRRKRYAITDRQIDVLFSVGGIASQAWTELQGTDHDPKVSLRVFQRAVAQMDPTLRATASHGWGGAVQKFVFAAKDAPYRGHTYCTDHTPAPVPVVAHRGSKTWFYPWVTVVWDECTRLALAADAYDHDPQAETTRDVIITALEGFDLDDGTAAGGMPEWFLSDRGSDLLGEINGLGLVRAGVGRTYSHARESYQNGIGEKNLGLLQDEWCRRLPGFQPGKRGSYDRDHPVQIAADRLLTLDQFRALLARQLHHWNEERSHGSLGGRTPAQAWAEDEQVVPAADPAALRMAMLKSDKTPKVGKNGVRFSEEDYIHPTRLRAYFGKNVEVRYLPRRPESIEVFYNGQHICRATLRKAQTDQNKGDLIADRKEIRKAFNAHALAGAKIAAKRANAELREMHFAEDELPAIPGDASDASEHKKPAKGRPVPKPAVSDDDLDRLDAAFGLGGDDWIAEHPEAASADEPRRDDKTGTDG